MTTVSIIGTGNMGGAIAAVAAKGGAQLQILDRDADKSAALAGRHGATASTLGDEITGDVVVLALPYGALDEVVSAHGAQFAGKVVVDITNPVDMATFDGLTVPADGSAAAELAGKLPDAKVVKAFNTNFAATLAVGSVGGTEQATTVLVAGDDADAKAAVIDVVTAGGLGAVDAGSLKRARELEALGFLQITLAAGEKVPWTGGFAVVG